MRERKYTQQDIVELHRVFGFIRDGILEHDSDIDIASVDRRYKVVMYRRHVFNHIYNEWFTNLSYTVLGREFGLSRHSVRSLAITSIDILKTDRTKPMWSKVHEANDLVETLYNNYINQ